MHLLHFSPIGNTTPHGQFVGTGGHVGAFVVGQRILHRLHFDPTGNTMPHGQLVGTGGHVGACVTPVLRILSVA